MTEVTPNPASGRAAKAAVPDGDLFPLVPEADVLDTAGPASDDAAAAVARIRFDVDQADAYEQHQSVPMDDDDYR